MAEQTVVTIDGREVSTYSEEWRACCEAVWVMNMPRMKRAKFFERLGDSPRARRLQDEMARLEPAYLLAFPDRDSRRAYLDEVEAERGPVAREVLEARVVALWKDRQAAAAAAKETA